MSSAYIARKPKAAACLSVSAMARVSPLARPGQQKNSRAGLGKSQDGLRPRSTQLRRWLNKATPTPSHLQNSRREYGPSRAAVVRISSLGETAHHNLASNRPQRLQGAVVVPPPIRDPGGKAESSNANGRNRLAHVSFRCISTPAAMSRNYIDDPVRLQPAEYVFMCRRVHTSLQCRCWIGATGNPRPLSEKGVNFS